MIHRVKRQNKKCGKKQLLWILNLELQGILKNVPSGFYIFQHSELLAFLNSKT